ncbi:MAG TPA: spore germination protein GerW family protein [Balneolales bacterium]|nr:spore germination protein GerW family protein [Balneolales bacterium]
MEADVKQVPDGEQQKATENRASKLIEHLIDRMGSKAAFGEPQTNGDITVIPVSEVRTGFGFGKGMGKKAEKEHGAESGSGSGAGGGGSVIPLGYIQMDKDQVRFKPFYNITRLTIAGMFLAAILITQIGKWLRS